MASAEPRRPARGFAVASRLAAPVDVVWERVASLEGVNHELGPVFRMTAPAGLALTPEAVPLGERWFRSWILLGGVLPVDYDDLTIVRLEPGRGFLERSSMLSQSVWEHERTLEPVPGGTLLIDRLAHEPRVPVAGGAQTALFRTVFRWRHRRLRRWFGEVDGTPARS